MQAGKQIGEWHRVQSALTKDRSDQASILEQQQTHEQKIQACQQRIKQSGDGQNPDDQLEHMLAAQELWMAEKELERFLEANQEHLFSLEQRIRDHQFALLSLRQTMDENWLIEYDRLSKRFANPVAEVRNDTCTGCHLALSIHNKDEWRKGKGLVHCDQCGRILI